MYTLNLPERELYDEKNNEFIAVPACTLKLEHSLVSVSKWESKWKKPFYSFKGNGMSYEEFIDYIRCMTISQNVNPNVYSNIPRSETTKIWDYINDTMTATWFSERKNGKSSNRKQQNRPITAELIYYWMIKNNIPFECRKWHLNRLITLIRVCEEEQSAGDNKQSRSNMIKDRRALNAARRKRLHTKG